MTSISYKGQTFEPLHNGSLLMFECSNFNPVQSCELNAFSLFFFSSFCSTEWTLEMRRHRMWKNVRCETEGDTSHQETHLHQDLLLRLLQQRLRGNVRFATSQQDTHRYVQLVCLYTMTVFTNDVTQIFDLVSRSQGRLDLCFIYYCIDLNLDLSEHRKIP